MKQILSALLSLALLFSICSASPVCAATASKEPDRISLSSDADYLDGVINASELFYINGVVFWGYENQLCSALIDSSGDLYDFVSEGSLSTGISYIASDGKDIYMSTDLGIVRLPLEQVAQSRSYLTVLDKHKLSHGFQLYGQELFFLYGSTLYSVPVSGGENRKLEKDIQCFQVTALGIYCLNKDGELLLLSLDGRERKTLCELDSEGDLGIFGNKAYISTGDEDDYIYVYDLEKNSCEKLELNYELSPYYPVWADGDKLYYRNTESDLCCYDLDSGKESLSDSSVALPDYDQGFLLDAFIYYKISNTLYWNELDGEHSSHIDSKDALVSGATVSAPSVSDYEIAQDISVSSSEGLARLESAHFTLYLPSDAELEYSVLSSTSIGIYYGPARKAGAGGNLVDICAYDLDDDSYKVLPHYTIAGESKNKRYVAIFPTDVQYSPETEDGWRELSDYVQRIDVNNKNNPFTCS